MLAWRGGCDLRERRCLNWRLYHCLRWLGRLLRSLQRLMHVLLGRLLWCRYLRRLLGFNLPLRLGLRLSGLLGLRLHGLLGLRLHELLALDLGALR